MKKIIWYILLYIIFCLLQLFFGKYINICGIYPNFILILIVYLGFLKGSVKAQLLGFLFGLTWDVFSTNIFGIRAVLFVIIGYVTGMFCQKFDRSQILTQLVSVFFTSLVYLLGFSFFYYIFSNADSYVLICIILSGILKIVATLFITPAVFHTLDRVYKKNI
jgi:rod shape-determining protein MreD